MYQGLYVKVEYLFSKEWRVQYWYGTELRLTTTTKEFPIEEILDWCKDN